MLTLITPPAALPVPAATIAGHLHLNTAAPELDETETLDRLIRAATATIERRLHGALIMQTWRWTATDWCAPLPLTPVAAIESVAVIDEDGAATPFTAWVLGHTNPQRIMIRTGETRPPVPPNGHVEIVFTAGYGLGWTDIPADLRHAVTLLAAHYYEHAPDPCAPLPGGIGALIAPYRSIRL